MGDRKRTPMNFMDEIVESRIAEAISRGELDNLPGCGKPLQLDDDRMVPEELRVAHRILKNSGHLPQQVHLRREISNIGCILAHTADPASQNASARRLNALLIKLSAANGKSADLRVEQMYYDKLVQRVAANCRRNSAPATGDQ